MKKWIKPEQTNRPAEDRWGIA